MHTVVTLTIFGSGFLFLTSLLQQFSKRTSFPYTVLLLLFGLLAQPVSLWLHLDAPVNLSADFIYFILLPLLLFESAMRINLHQFKLQFKTITFLSTAGLLISIATIGGLMHWLLGTPLGIGLLFGALISATDPISVLSLFKSLGAPKRLSLLAEGESMFNDATAVIAFRVIAGFVVASQVVSMWSIASGIATFVYVFVGSIVLGTILGILTSLLISKIKEDHIIETTLTIAASLGSFVVAEHFFHLSGVITCVIAGITLGNYGKTKISAGVVKFMEEIWEYISFLAVSLIFFFTAFSLDLTSFTRPGPILVVIGIVLLARAVSVYVSFKITNRAKPFVDEPNVIESWQHIINWGGLRGVIPLVLVFSLPDSFSYKSEALTLSLAVFLFTLLINGLTIKWLIIKLKLHLPGKEMKLIKEERSLLELSEALKTFSTLNHAEFDKTVLRQTKEKLHERLRKKQRLLSRMITKRDFEKSLSLESLEIERATYQELFLSGHITDDTLYDLESELDLQQDALEYPEVYAGRSYRSGGRLESREAFRRRIRTLKQVASRVPWLKQLTQSSMEDVVFERYCLLKARVVSSQAVIEYLTHLKKRLGKTSNTQAITSQITRQRSLIAGNQGQAASLEAEYPGIVHRHQRQLLESLLFGPSATAGHT